MKYLKYEVKKRFSDGKYRNAWLDKNGNPKFFITCESARKALIDYLDELKEAGETQIHFNEFIIQGVEI